MEFPAGRSPIETIPTEVLTMIAGYLVPENYHELHNAEGRASYRQDRSKLANLCLVSKSMGNVARPILLSKVFLYQSKELILFHRALNENQNLGKHVQMLVLATPFLRNHKDHEALDFSLLRGVDSDFDSIQSDSSAGISSLAENQARFNIYLKILSNAQSVKDVAMNTPSWMVRGLDDEYLPDFRQASIVSASRITPAQTPQLQHLTSLTTLAIEGQSQGRVESLPGELARFWSRQSNLKTMIWIKEDRRWFRSLPCLQLTLDGIAQQCTTLTSMQLLQSNCGPFQVVTICSSFPCLQTLQIASSSLLLLDSSGSNWADRPADVMRRFSLSRNIAKLQDLQTLVLELFDAPDSSKLIGNGGVLDLSSLPKLTELTVSFKLFVSEQQISITGKNADPFLLLPQSLAGLTLIVRGFKTEAGKNLGNFLEDLQAATIHSFPRLRDVVYVYGVGMPPLGPGRTCVCGRFWHEDYCTFDENDPLAWAQPFTYLPWVPAQRLEAFVKAFGQRNIQLVVRQREALVKLY
ncbi:hypothetical protein Daus18300_012412 [Diaporthe australafricana]|uniref:F-box domain-containing protein n=1 Tax=Diaporthe australafricana TaxID=127596 RepID=A0ABR3W305_9PEZI